MRVRLEDLPAERIEQAKSTLMYIRQCADIRFYGTERLENLFWVLEAIYGDDLYELIDRAIMDTTALARFVKLEDDAKKTVINMLTRTIKEEEDQP